MARKAMGSAWILKTLGCKSCYLQNYRTKNNLGTLLKKCFIHGNQKSTTQIWFNGCKKWTILKEKNETNLTFQERNVTNDNILDMFLSEHFIKLNPWHWTWYSVLYSYMASCLDTEKQWQFSGLLWGPLKKWVISPMTTFRYGFPLKMNREK